MNKKQDLSFDDWYRQVNMAVQRRIGLSVYCLVDFDSYSMYAAGESPENAAEAAILNDDTYCAFLTGEEL